jgi:hypothetical protein
MKTENFIKGPLTTLLGLGLIVVAVVARLTEYLKDINAWEALGLAAAGFGLMFMRDEIPGFIRNFINKKTQ